MAAQVEEKTRTAARAAMGTRRVRVGSTTCCRVGASVGASVGMRVGERRLVTIPSLEEGYYSPGFPSQRQLRSRWPTIPESTLVFDVKLVEVRCGRWECLGPAPTQWWEGLVAAPAAATTQ